MKIVVLGLWHLGCVTAACCARHFQVVGLDDDEPVVAGLHAGKAPLFEPGLNELIASGLVSRQLAFSTDPAAACAGADILWCCYDTPVNENDESDIDFVLSRLRRALSALPTGALVLISSQLPVGSCALLEREFPQFHFASSPENLRLGKAIEVFTKADRFIVGLREGGPRERLAQLLAPFTSQVLFMRTESAEMVKHALNGFLALSVTYINEIARLCERTGADAKEVASGLKSDVRIGPRAYLGPGGPFAGGTLARDVVTLTRLGQEYRENLALIPAIKQSNDQHRGWNLRRLESRFGDLRGRAIAVLGLTYKPGTDTLRRSAAVELCSQLVAAGASVRAFDPAVPVLPAELQAIQLAADAAEALRGVDAGVICTEWPEFRQVVWADALADMRHRVILDANRFLEKELKDSPGVEHISVGRAT
jgi:UDPglucose 6-dehydrogenase